MQNVVKTAAALKLAEHTSRTSIDAALARHIPDAGMRSFLCQNLVPPSASTHGHYTWRINLPVILASMPNFATFPHYPPRRDLSCAFIRGELSDFVSDAHWEESKKLFPSAHLHTLPGARHWLHADKPVEFVDLLARVLAAWR